MIPMPDIPRLSVTSPSRRATRALAAAAALLLAACMPPAATGGRLAPAVERTSNAVVQQDRLTLVRWDERLRRARATEDGLPGDSAIVRRRAAARAAAWLAVAREAYDADPAATLADSALDEAARLVVLLERGRDDGTAAAALAVADTAPPRAGLPRVREDLWQVATLLRGTGEDERAAEAEVLLLHTAYVARATGATPPGAPTCGPWTSLARAERLLREAAPTVVLARRADGLPVPRIGRVPNDSIIIVDTVRTPLPRLPFGRGVHFALNSSTLSPTSRRLLDSTVKALSLRAELAVVLEGHTDPRGSQDYNAKLSMRRAETVRDYLMARGLQPARIELRGLGPSQRAGMGETPLDFAIDRRVVLRFFEPDGREYTAADESRLDLQVEMVRRRRVARPAPKGPAKAPKPAPRPAARPVRASGE